MSPQTIEMRFKEVMELAVRLKELSRKLSCVSEEEINQSIYRIKACWNSEGADILVGKEVQIGARLTREAFQLGSLADKIEDQARKMYQSEMANAGIAATRIY